MTALRINWISPSHELELLSDALNLPHCGVSHAMVLQYGADYPGFRCPEGDDLSTEVAGRLTCQSVGAELLNRNHPPAQEFGLTVSFSSFNP